MKRIIAINCSPRTAWNTAALVREAAKGAEAQGAEVTVIDLYKLEKFTGCVSCFGCKLPEHLFSDPNMEYPKHLLSISYSLEPDITGRGFMIQDCDHGDKPRQKKRDLNEFEPVAVAHAAAIGVIGGTDGPTAVIMGTHKAKLHAVCSSLHFEPVEEVEWRAVFSEKLMEDVEVCLT